MSEVPAAGLRPDLDASLAWVAEALEDAVWLFDLASGRVVYANAACEAVWGLGRTALPADPAPLLQALHEQERDRLRPDDVWRPATPFVQELRLVPAQGRVRWVQHRSVPLRDADGQPVATLGITRDVSLRHEAEAARRASEERFDVLARNAFEVITELDAAGHVVWANKSAPSATFQRTADAPVRPRPDLIHPDDRKHTVAKFRAAFRDGADTRISYRAADVDGSWHWLETFVSPFQTQGGERRMLLMSRDVTQRRQILDELRENEERYRQLVEQSPLGIVVHAEGRMLYANPAAVRLTGALSAANLAGRAFLDLVEPGSAAEVSAQLARLAGGARSEAGVEFGLCRRDGEKRVVIGNGSLVRYGGRSACQYVMSDITDRKLAEQERERLAAQLQEARKLESLGVLAGGIAHDFNNLLAVVLATSGSSCARACWARPARPARRGPRSRTPPVRARALRASRDSCSRTRAGARPRCARSTSPSTHARSAGCSRRRCPRRCASRSISRRSCPRCARTSRSSNR